MFPYILLLFIVFIGLFKGEEERSINKRQLFNVLCFLLLFFTCFHYRLGCDALEFEDELFPSIPVLDRLQFNRLFDYGTEPLIVLLCSISKTIWDDYLLFQILHGLFVNIVLMRYFWRKTQYPFVAMFIFLTYSYYYYNYEIQRQSIVLCIFLIIEKYIHQRKYLKYYLGALIAVGFHYSGTILFLLPILKDVKINKKSIVMLFALLVGLFVIGNYLQSIPEIALLQSNANISSKLTVYTDESRSAVEAGILNPYILLTKIVMPFTLVFWGNKYIDKRYHSYLLLYLLFSASTVVSVPILNRFADYFTPFYIIMLSNYIFYISQVRKRPLQSSIRFIILLFVVTFNFYSWFMIKSYNPKLRNYVKIYPYSSVFYPEKNADRENAGWKYLSY